MHVLHNANELLARVRLAFLKLLQTRKRAETTINYQKQVLFMIKLCWETHKLTRYRSKDFSYRTFFYRTNTKVYVPVNFKTAHPPRAIPRHLTRVKLRTVGDLTQKEARPVGHLTSLSKRLSAVGNKRISQFFALPREPGHCSGHVWSIPRGFFCCCRFI